MKTTYCDVLKAQLNALEIEYNYMCDSDLFDDKDCEHILNLIDEKNKQIESWED